MNHRQVGLVGALGLFGLLAATTALADEARPTATVRGSIQAPRVCSKASRGILTYESGRYLFQNPTLEESRPAGNDLSRPLPLTRESLPVYLPDSE